MTHKSSHVILLAIVATGEFNDADCAKLTAIAEKDGRCTIKDAETAARILKKKLREPVEEQAD